MSQTRRDIRVTHRVMSSSILVVEDEADLASTLEFNLQREGHRVRVALSGNAAIEELDRTPPPDLVLLDLMLPDISGIEICKRIRQQERTRAIPVIMLTARAEELDRVVGFEVGADDYVVKPFSVRELMLRVRALLRRASPSENEAEVVTFGRVKIDREGHRTWVDGSEVKLTALEFRLLSTFVQRRGRVQSRHTLLTDVWGMAAEVSTRTVDTHIKRLREKLGEAGHYIETLRGVGYRFRENPDE